MGEAHFGTVDGTISGRFDDSKEWCKVGIQYYAVNEILTEDQSNYRTHTRRVYLHRIHLESSQHETVGAVRGISNEGIVRLPTHKSRAPGIQSRE
jgi:hypothetical protein